MPAPDAGRLKGVVAPHPVGRPAELRVFIVQGVPEEALTDLRGLASVDMFEATDRIITRDELLARTEGCQFLWALGEVPVDAGVMAAADLRLIGIMEITSRAVDIPAATARGIPVTTLPNMDAVTTSTAEHTLALLLALARRLPDAERLLRDGHWAQYQSMALLGTRIAGKVLGIVGLGTVGRKLAARARACEMTVIYTDRQRFDEDLERALEVEWRDIDAVFREADFLALTPTLTASSRGLASAERLASMKPTAYLINTSRGAVVDEEALVRLLRARPDRRRSTGCLPGPSRPRLMAGLPPDWSSCRTSSLRHISGRRRWSRGPRWPGSSPTASSTSSRVDARHTSSTRRSMATSRHRHPSDSPDGLSTWRRRS